MTFGDYIKTLNATGVFKFNRNQLAIHLKNAAEIQAGDDAVIKWIDRNAPANIGHYVSNGRVNESEVIRFFRLWAHDSLRILQNEFREKEDCVVDCDTDDREIFYLSLLNQFLVSLGLPRSEMERINTNKLIAKVMHKYMYPEIVGSPIFQAVANDEEKAALAYLDEITQMTIKED